MPNDRAVTAGGLVFAIVALGHAAISWPGSATVALFAGGMTVAFVAEVVGIRLELLEHHVRPQIAGVPVYAIAGWPAVAYVAFRVALLWTTGWPAVGLAALLATAYDVLTDPAGVQRGQWSYSNRVPGPSWRGVPWWNFAAWFVISGTTCGLALPFL